MRRNGKSGNFSPTSASAIENVMYSRDNSRYGKLKNMFYTASTSDDFE
jgi:hypothetical protein